MIRKTPTPTIGWAFAALAAGIIGMIGMWAWRFGNTLWGLDNGVIMELGWRDATYCLWPWDALQCRELFRINGYSNFRKINEYQVWVFAPLVIGLGFFAYGVYERWLRPRWRIILAGPTVSDYRGLIAASKAELSKGGLPMYGEWTISDLRALNGMIVFGGQGSGKTNLLRHLLKSITEVGDRKIVYGYKSHVYALMPREQPTSMDPQGNGILINPADERSWVWAVARDVRTRADCINLAKHLIKNPEYIYFEQAGQGVAAVVIIMLHSRMPGEWTWSDLFDAFTAPKETLAEWAQEYHPSALTYINADERQWSSTRTGIQNAINNFELLSIAWGDYTGRKLVSIHEFMQGNSLPKTIVLGHSGRFDEISGSWIAAFYTIACKSVFHENFKQPIGQRTWFILDEFARLAKIDGIEELVSAGRERGAPVVLGLQDFHAVEKVYGPEAFKTWMSSIQTKVICRTEPGETASWLMKILGSTRIKELRTKPAPGGGNMREWHEYEDNALRESEMSSELGVVKDKGTWVVVLGYGRDLYRVLVPFVDRTEVRPGYVEAEWIRETSPPQRRQETAE
ncbi:type IV secretion system DNA-binding domain-containing protein [Aureimonas ureilytica]|uniref:type IV secretion system DNA-binding domain-containing protein n=1 Tax=Aureimonas ureilytica TaxID=401562 RepID=UPI0003675748|nr:type IV secretion system DNA-binding domain-containing protein [Aureimonas ureilytica]